MLFILDEFKNGIVLVYNEPTEIIFIFVILHHYLNFFFNELNINITK